MPAMGSTIGQSYEAISGCLALGLKTAGIIAEAHGLSIDYQRSGRNNRLPCFLAPNRSELMVKGKKLVGSAQKRTAHAVLQHGSIPIDGRFRRLTEFMAIPPDERTRLKALLGAKCICAQEIIQHIAANDLADCLIRGFKEILTFPTFEEPWGTEELSMIELEKI